MTQKEKSLLKSLVEDLKALPPDKRARALDMLNGVALAIATIKEEAK